jgi:hypothetical protein
LDKLAWQNWKIDLSRYTNGLALLALLSHPFHFSPILATGHFGLWHQNRIGHRFSTNSCRFLTLRADRILKYVLMVKEIEISIESYNFLEKARLPGEDLNETLLRLIKRYEQTMFLEHQKQILEHDDFQLLNESKK